MTRVVFIGPSLPSESGWTDAGIELRPPARCGDILRAVVAGARTIGLVDGVFEGARSTWHKEILWALSVGVPVAGAASMGALRAAEMHTFGMVGVGRIFRAYRDGTLEDDDEVAVVHAPPELGFRPLSDAMVNIRETLRRARRQGIIGKAAHDALVGLGKRMFFKDRTFERILASTDSHLRAEVARLRRWLPTNAIDVKRADARALIGTLDRLKGPTRRPRFVSSRHWDALVSELATPAEKACTVRAAFRR